MSVVKRVLSATVSAALALGLLSSVPSSAEAVSAASKKSFVTSMISPAQEAQRKYGVPASVLIAEAALRSEWGTSDPAKKAKNYFHSPCRLVMDAAAFRSTALAQVGKPYVLGAEASITNANPPKFDCSELVEWLYGRSGNRITDLAAAQYNATKAVSINSPKVGDLVFLKNNPARANGIGHVAVLTKKLSNGDWEIVEARGRAYGVVKTTLSYWKDRKYFAGLRRQDTFFMVGQAGIVADPQTNLHQNGCVVLTVDGKSTKFGKFASVAASFAERARVITTDASYKDAVASMSNVTSFVTNLAKADQGKNAAAWAKSLREIIDTYNLTDQDVVPFTIVLSSKSSPVKVSALQYLLLANGVSVKVTAKYDAATIAAVKKFQTAKKLTSDGEAGPKTLAALAPELKAGANGDGVAALHALLEDLGFAIDAGNKLGAKTTASLKALQSSVGLSASGTSTANTWARLFMSLEPTPAPQVDGTPVVDGALTASVAAWGVGGKANLSYQWLRDGKPIPGAAAADYSPTAADVGANLQVAVTGTQPPYTELTRASAATDKVIPAKLAKTGKPTISGTAKIGETLKVDPGTWAPAGVNLSYQWYRGDTAIKGATKANYLVQDADAQSTLKVSATGTLAGYETVSQLSAATAKVPAAPKPVEKSLFTSEVTLSGKVAVGKKLTAKFAVVSEAKAKLTYQWYRGNSKIKNATKASYTLTATDKGQTIKVKVTAAAPGYDTSTKTSPATRKTTIGVFTTGLTLTGTPAVGKKLTVEFKTWNEPKAKFSYQWYRGEAKIKKAAKASYTINQADKGKTIKVKVTAAAPGYDTITKTSATLKVK